MKTFTQYPNTGTRTGQTSVARFGHLNKCVLHAMRWDEKRPISGPQVYPYTNPTERRK